MTTATEKRGHRASTKLIVDLWKEGRSVAGIVMELKAVYGLELKARSVLRQIRRLREDDNTIPPAQGGGTGDLLDERAQW